VKRVKTSDVIARSIATRLRLEAELAEMRRLKAEIDELDTRDPLTRLREFL